MGEDILGRSNPDFYFLAARNLGMSIEMIDESIGLVRYQDKELFINRTNLSCNNVASGYLVVDKYCSTGLLRKRGFPVPRNRLFHSDTGFSRPGEHQLVKEFARTIYPVVCKPNQGSLSKHVVIDIRNDDELDQYLHRYPHYRYNKVLVEEYIPGTSYRVLIVRGKVIDVVKTVPGSVIGDGERSVRELIEQKTYRQQHLDINMKVTEDITKALNRQNIAPEGIPECGRKITIDLVGRKETGLEYKSVDIQGIPEANIRMWIEAANSMGLGVAGLDFITEDIRLPWNQIRCAINEINVAPFMKVHAGAHPEEPLAIPEKVLKCLFEIDWE